MWILVMWLGIGVIASGLLNADMKASFPLLAESPKWRRKTLGISLGFAIGGPVCLFMALCVTGFAADGWDLTTKETTQSDIG